jgi:hypothetical protein
MKYFKYRQSYWRKWLLIGLIFGITYALLAIALSVSCEYIPFEDYDPSLDNQFCRNWFAYLTLILPIYFVTIFSCMAFQWFLEISYLYSCGTIIHIIATFISFVLISSVLGLLIGWFLRQDKI